MKNIFSSFVVVLVLVFFSAGCGSVGVGVGVQVELGGDPSKEKTEKTETAAAAPAPPSQEADKPDTPPPPPPDRPTLEEVQKKREMEASLRAAFDEFWGLIKQKNVDSASALIVSERREEIKNELYRFLAKYSLTRYDISELTPNFGTTSDSEVAGYIMIYEKGAVTPFKKEIFQRWRHNGKWFLVSSSIK